MAVEDTIQGLLDAGVPAEEIMATARSAAKRRYLARIEEQISPSVLKKKDLESLGKLIEAFQANASEADLDAPALAFSAAVRAEDPSAAWRAAIILIGTFFKLRPELWNA